MYPIRNKIFKFVIPILFVFVLLSVYYLLHPLAGSLRIHKSRVMPSLVLRLSSDPKSFNPILAQETSTTSVTSLMFIGLVKIDPFTQEPVPELAKKWERSSDGLRWVFYLRDGLKWSDGKPLTAYDVEFTFNKLIYNPNIPNSACDIFTINGKHIKVKALDEHRVEFILPSVFAPFLQSMTQEILPKHILESSVNNNTFCKQWNLSVNPEKVVCNGPFRLHKYTPGQLVELESNPYYYRKDSLGKRLPYIKRVIMLVIPSDDTAMLKFLEGEIDIMSLRCSDYILLKRLNKKGIRLFKLGPSLGTNFLAFNQNPNSPLPAYKLSWFRNVFFRRALAYAIDKQGMINTVYDGLAVPQWGPMNKSNGFFYNSQLCKYDFDLKKAKEMLYSLGFKDRDNDGVLEDSNGDKLELNIITNANSSERLQIVSIIAEDFRRVGIKVNYRGVDFNSLVVRLTNSYDWELVLIGLTGGTDPYFGKNVWYSKGALHLWWPKQRFPHTSWEKQIDQIFDKAVTILDRKQRKQLYDRWQKIISCEVPVIYTVTPLRLYAVRDRLENIVPSPYGGLLYNLDEIKIKRTAWR